MRAVKILTDPVAGVRLKASSVTVSTVGLVPQIQRFCADPGNGASLAISLHAVTDELRDKVRGPLFLQGIFCPQRQHFCSREKETIPLWRASMRYVYGKAPSRARAVAIPL